MKRINKLKYLGKAILPNWSMSFLRKIKSIFIAWNYWLPYVFMDGRARNPRALTLELTFRCNLSCVMCPQAIDLRNEESVLKAQMKEEQELKTEDLLRVIGQAGNMAVERIIVTGGEPFIRNDIVEILNAIKDNNMQCNIISNGGLMKESLAKTIVSIGIEKITFSCDGPEDVHNEIRQNKRQFNDLISAIRMINKEKKLQKKYVPDLTLNMTVSALNADHMSELVDIAKNEGVNVNYGYLFYTSEEMEKRTNELYQSTGCKVEDQDVPMEIRSVNVGVIASEIKKIKEKASNNGVKVNIQPYIVNEQELHDRFYEDDSAYVHRCFYPWYAMRINPYGDVYPCQMNVLFGNVRSDELKDIWNNKEYVNFRKELRSVGIWPKCTKCCVLNDRLWDRLPIFSSYWKKR